MRSGLNLEPSVLRTFDRKVTKTVCFDKKVTIDKKKTVKLCTFEEKTTKK